MVIAIIVIIIVFGIPVGWITYHAIKLRNNIKKDFEEMGTKERKIEFKNYENNTKNVFYTHNYYDNKARRVTVCGLIEPETNKIRIGIATCGHKEQFRKDMGRKISFGRAISKQAFIYSLSDENWGKQFHTIVKTMFI